MNIEDQKKNEILKWWIDLPPVLKFGFAEKHHRFVEKCVERYIEKVDNEDSYDDLYYQLRQDDTIIEVLKNYDFIRWNMFDSVCDMLSFGSSGSDDYEYFTDNDYLSGILFDVALSSSDWFIDIIFGNNALLLERELIAYKNSKTLKFNNVSMLIDYENEKLPQFYDLKALFPKHENIIFGKVTINDFEFISKLDYLKFIHFGIIEITFKHYPDTMEYLDPITVKSDIDDSDCVEYLTIKYKDSNPDVILLNTYLELIATLKFANKIKFSLDIENSEWMQEVEILEIIKKRFPKMKMKRIYNPITVDEIQVGK